MDATLKIFEYLDENGIEVHFPNTHKEPVTTPVTVITDMGQMPQIGTNYVGNTSIHLILHVNQDKYHDMIAYKKKVKDLMKCLKHYVKPTGLETPTVNDDIKKSYTSSIEYVVYKKL